MDSDDLNELYDEPGLDSDGNSQVDSSDSSDEDDTQARPPVKFLPTSKQSIPLTNQLICLVKIAWTLGLLTPQQTKRYW